MADELTSVAIPKGETMKRFTSKRQEGIKVEAFKDGDGEVLYQRKGVLFLTAKQLAKAIKPTEGLKVKALHQV